jgi:hypothetical protein
VATYPGGIPSLPRPTGSTTMDSAGFTGAEVVDGLSDEVEAIATELGTDPAGASATVAARLDALDTTVGGKAASSHTHSTSDITSLAEFVRDTIGATLVAGSNVTVTVDDAGDTITVASTGSGGLDAEQVRDAVAAFVTAGANISVTHNDAGDTLTIAVTGLDSGDVSDFAEAVRDTIGTALTAGTGMTVTPNDGADTITVATSAILPTVVDAKGDLLVGTAADTVARLAVGTNDYVLTADSAEAAGMKWAAASGGSGATVSSGTAAPSGGSDGDWYLRRTTGQWYEKVSGTWTLRERSSSAANLALAAAAGSNYATAGGWSAGATGYYTFAGSTAQTQTLFSSQTGSPTFSGTSITVAGASLGAANAKAAIKGVREAYALFGIETMPSAGRNLYVGMGMDFTYPYCYIGISNAGVATLYTGGGGAVKTFAGTVAVGDYVNFTLVGGALLVAITSSAYALRDQALFASELVVSAYIEAQGIQVLVGGDGKASLTILEVMP